MEEHKQVYATEAVRYDTLVSKEDYQGNIIKAIQGVTPLENLDVVELGAGTGRLTMLLAPYVHTLKAFDASQSMLDEATVRLVKAGFQNCELLVADNRSVPVNDQSADLVISGWSICYFADWDGGNWQREALRSFAEMKRILRNNGKIILLETMGTGFETPHPPAHLAGYYELLNRLGFKSDWFRTDYKFKTLSELIDLVSFFFGEELSSQVEKSGRLTLPECTGIWWIDIRDLLLPGN